jgi:ABC-type dipeptide/oligopeptide/nickel transport system permease component
MKRIFDLAMAGFLFCFLSVPIFVVGLIVNPVRNSSGALNPTGIILKSNPAAAAGPEGL